MIAKTIKYEDFDGNMQEETFWFHLTEAELTEMQYSVDGGLRDALERIVKTNDLKGLIAEFKQIVLKAYGEKSADGKRFMKSDEIRKNFECSAAYSALFMELATDDVAAANFVNGIMPKNLSQKIQPEKTE